MKSEKGVTLITLVITIVVLIILTFSVTVNLDQYGNQKIRTDFETDIRSLKEEIDQYYAREKSLPIINKFTNISMLETIKNINDNDQYYIIDLEKLNIELNYGKDYYTIKENNESGEITDLIDVYIINEKSHTIYYPKGIEYNGQMNYMLIDEYSYMEDIEIIEVIKDSGVYLNKTTEVEDLKGNKIIIPKGFKVAEDSALTVEDGIVIEDKDIIEGIGNNRGNQYVWIPVGERIKKKDGTSISIELGRYIFADGTSHKDEEGNILEKGTPILKQSAENYLDETVIDTYYKEVVTSRTGIVNNTMEAINTTALNLKRFIDSVNTNGGYYIARYEASYGEDGKVNSKVSNSYSTSKPTEEGMLWNNITQIDAAVASRYLYETATTDLINSYAWDTAIVYIQKFSQDKDYSYQTTTNTSLDNTGVNGDEVCKINDMASNTLEYTTEYYSDVSGISVEPCVARGGFFGGSTNWTSKRGCYSAANSIQGISFRSMLYI